jgi:hypothetical protein
MHLNKKSATLLAKDNLNRCTRLIPVNPSEYYSNLCQILIRVNSCGLKAPPDPLGGGLRRGGSECYKQ